MIPRSSESVEANKLRMRYPVGYGDKPAAV